MNFEIIGEITDVETIAVGSGIRDIARLRRVYGRGRWRKLKGATQVRLRSGRIRLAEVHWYEAHGIGKREIKRKRYLGSGIWIRSVSGREEDVRFAVCVNNTDYPASLELHKIYRVLPDEDAEADGDLRVVDESGEDYLYPAEYFVLVELPRSVEQSLLQRA